MKIANSASMFRILFTEAEYNEIDEKTVGIAFALSGVDNFVTIYVGEMPDHAIRMSINRIPNSGAGTSHPYQILFTKTKADKKFRFLKQLSLFAPEAVTMHPKKSYAGGFMWEVTRPAMTTPTTGGYKRGRKPKQEAPRVQPQETSIAALRASTATVQEVLPPKVLPMPDRGQLSEAATLSNLRNAVNMINAAKDHYGDRLIIETRGGKIVLLLEIDGQD